MTALRELAERWKAEAAQWMIRGEDVPQTLDACADELLAILDADGDGGAVDRDVLAVGVRARNIEITRQQRSGEPNNEDHALRIGIAAALATHPARSGVVSDEDVEAACAEELKRYREVCPNASIDGADFDAGFYAALEHFARRTP